MEDKFTNPAKGQGALGEIKKTQTHLEINESLDKQDKNKSLTEQISNGTQATNAIYKVLDFLPEQDPLKNKAKEKALAILENLTLIYSAQGWVSLQKEKASAMALDDIEILKSYLKIAKGQGWIDNVNFLIITKEYNAIKSNINPPEGIIKRSIGIGYSFMQIPSRTPHTVEVKENLSSTNANQKSDINNIKPIGIKKYSERQEKILQILHKSGKAQVADFIKELPNITKRTIRRDLDDLLKEGKIVRIGQWNQVFYILAREGHKVI